MQFSSNNNHGILCALALLSVNSAAAFAPSAASGAARNGASPSRNLQSVRLQTLASPNPEQYGAFDPTVLVQGAAALGMEETKQEQQQQRKQKQHQQGRYVSPTWQGLTKPTKAFAGLAAALAASMVLNAPGLDVGLDSIAQWNAVIGSGAVSWSQQFDISGLADHAGVADAFASWTSNADVLVEAAKAQSHDLLLSAQSSAAAWAGQIQDVASRQASQAQAFLNDMTAQGSALSAENLHQVQDSATAQVHAWQESTMSAITQAEDVTVATARAWSAEVSTVSQDLMTKAMAWFHQMLASMNSDWVDVLQQKLAAASTTASDAVSQQSQAVSSSLSDASSKVQAVTSEMKDTAAAAVSSAAAKEAASMDMLVRTFDSATELVTAKSNAVAADLVSKASIVDVDAAKDSAISAVSEPTTATSITSSDATTMHWNEARRAAVRANEMQYDSLMQKVSAP
eukprot:CAMPEP_0119570440 /NCGR_PEP_ID=MMETSP1352-20130426/43614_1 /TAXON_ID=265584 /ORGANISM="Stauroneis constricta, Strain CCMP1120" /LENGTH=456 /DNA_ID=CAMNT_0007620109 /DNA_START=558 /DNA_END=1928 /DNA_ORIENTATION=-